MPLRATSNAAAAPPSPSAGLQLARSLLLVAAFSAYNHLSDVVSERWGLDALSFTSPLKLGVFVLGLAITFGGIIFVGCVWLGKASLRDLGWCWENPGRLVALGLLQTALLAVLIFSVYFVFGGVAGIQGLLSAIATMPVGERVFFLLMGAKVSFLEETLFRGDLLHRLSALGGVAAAIVLSSVAFALFHRTLSPVPLLMKFVFGVSFCVFSVRSGSLVPSMLGHTLMWTIFGND